MGEILGGLGGLLLVVEAGGGLKAGGISTSSLELITNSGGGSCNCVPDTVAAIGLQSSSVPTVSAKEHSITGDVAVVMALPVGRLVGWLIGSSEKKKEGIYSEKCL